MSKISQIADIKPDPRNANKGTQRGRALLEQSLRQLGAGRSILVDRNGIAIAGNKTLDVAAELKLKVQEVETDGNTLIVVKRTDLDLLKDKRAKELAIADNRTSEVGLDWDPAVLADDDFDFVRDWFTDQELKGLNSSIGNNSNGGNGSLEYKYHVIIDCQSEKQQLDVLQSLEAQGLSCRALIL